MELTGKMEEFMNDLIGERMEQVYQEKDDVKISRYTILFERRNDL